MLMDEKIYKTDKLMSPREKSFLSHSDTAALFASMRLPQPPPPPSESCSDSSSGSVSGCSRPSPTRSESPSPEPGQSVFSLPRRSKTTLCSKKLYRCQQCKYVTDRKNNLKRHFVTMHEKCSKLLECCDMVFANKAALREHVVGYHKQGYGCRICGRTFCRKALLKRHITVHSGQKDYVCGICGYATSHKSNLDRHKRRHSQGYLGGFPEGFLGVKEFSSSPELSPLSSPNPLEQSYLTTFLPNNENIISDRIYLQIMCHRNRIRDGKYFFPKRLLFTHADHSSCKTETSREVGDSAGTRISPPPEEHVEQRPEKAETCPSSRRLAPALYRCPQCQAVLPNQLELSTHLRLHPDPPSWPQRPLTLQAKPAIRRWAFE